MKPFSIPGWGNQAAKGRLRSNREGFLEEETSVLSHEG